MSQDHSFLYTIMSACSADLCLHRFKYIILKVIRGGSELRPADTFSLGFYGGKGGSTNILKVFSWRCTNPHRPEWDPLASWWPQPCKVSGARCEVAQMLKIKPPWPRSAERIEATPL